MKIIEPEKKFVENIGDIWVEPQVKNVLSIFDSEEYSHLLWLSIVREDVISAPEKMFPGILEGINATEQCPYTGREYYPLLPVALLSNAIGQYKSILPKSLQYEEFAAFLAESAMKDFKETNPQCPGDIFGLGDVETLLLGSGYDFGRIVSDGSREWKWCTLRLDNGDAFLCAVLIWYNK